MFEGKSGLLIVYCMTFVVVLLVQCVILLTLLQKKRGVGVCFFLNLKGKFYSTLFTSAFNVRHYLLHFVILLGKVLHAFYDSSHK